MKSKLLNLITVASLLAAAGTTLAYLNSRAGVEKTRPDELSANSLSAPKAAKQFALSASKPAADAVAKPRNASERLAQSLSSEQHERLLNLINEGEPRDLLRIHGVGKTRAEAIQAARPYDSVVELAKVHGVGEVTFASVIEYAKQLGEQDTVVAVASPSSR